jgi:hypothetical protein
MDMGDEWWVIWVVQGENGGMYTGMVILGIGYLKFELNVCKVVEKYLGMWFGIGVWGGYICGVECLRV